VPGGYLQARIMRDGEVLTKNFGKPDSLSVEMAQEWLVTKKKEHRENKFGIVRELPRKKFEEVARTYITLWSSERDANGLFKHTQVAIHNQVWRVESVLIPHFGKKWYDTIRPVDVQNWRDERVKKVQGTTADKEQIALSSIYSHVKDWINLEKIPAFKIPEINFCESVKKAPIQKRTRILTTTEGNRLHQACIQANDLDMWEMVKLALKSALRPKDMIHLEQGEIDTIQAKTGRPIQLPVTLERVLDYTNFRKRWELVRKMAGLSDLQFRDLRKTAATFAKMKGHSNKLISEYLGHASTKTTELYLVPNASHLKPIADDIAALVDSL